jgi:hypothetical protein
LLQIQPCSPETLRPASIKRQPSPLTHLLPLPPHLTNPQVADSTTSPAPSLQLSSSNSSDNQALLLTYDILSSSRQSSSSSGTIRTAGSSSSGGGNDDQQATDNDTAVARAAPAVKSPVRLINPRPSPVFALQLAIIVALNLHRAPAAVTDAADPAPAPAANDDTNDDSAAADADAAESDDGGEDGGFVNAEWWVAEEMMVEEEFAGGEGAGGQPVDDSAAAPSSCLPAAPFFAPVGPTFGPELAPILRPAPVLVAAPAKGRKGLGQKIGSFVGHLGRRTHSIACSTVVVVGATLKFCSGFE